MSNKNNNFFSSIENTLSNSGLRTESFLLSDSEVGSYWNSSSHVCVIGKDNYGVVADNLDKLEKITFPKLISSTKSYIDFTKDGLNKQKLNTLLFETNNDVRDYYNPLKKYPTLFREFSELGYDTNSILNFIKKYGMLGGDISIKKDNDFHESIYAWYWEIYHMNLCIKLIQYSSDEWTILRELDHKDLLENYFSIEGGNEIHLDIKRINQNANVPAKYFIECYGMLDDDEKNYPIARILSNLARKYAQSIIEDHLDYRLQIQHNKELKDIKPLSLLSIKVDGLIGALWLQLYQYAAGLTKFGICQTCTNWFIESDKRVTTRKKFCSNKCKMSNMRGGDNRTKIINLFRHKNVKDLLLALKNEENINFSNQGISYKPDIVLFSKKTKKLDGLIEFKTRKKRREEEIFSKIDSVMKLYEENKQLNKAYVFFQDECWGRTKNNKNWKQLGSLNDPKFNPFLKL